MKTLWLSIAVIFTTLCANAQQSVDAQALTPSDQSQQCLGFLQHTEKKLHASETINLCTLTAGKPVLIVNTASHCGFTPQFSALETIHKKYKEQGLVVIGFPSDDFFQEEDDEKDTADICFVNYGVTFTMVAPVHVWGNNVHPIFKHLADKTTAPKWNFYKYLVSADGKTIQHFNSRVTPDSAIFVDAINDII